MLKTNIVKVCHINRLNISLLINDEQNFKSMNTKTTYLNDLISIIENFDYSNFTDSKYQVIKNVMFDILGDSLPSPIVTYSSDEWKIYRARKNKENKPFEKTTDLWHPPAKLVPHGRLNFKYKPIIYCATNASTALIEIGASKEKYITTIEYEVLNPSIKCLEFGLENIFDSDRNYENDRVKKISNFLHRECKKVIPQNRPECYSPTMIFSSIVQNNNFDAFIYESVASEHKGLNIAIKEKIAPQILIPRELRMLEVYNVKSNTEFDVRCILKSINNFNSLDQKIEWAEVTECNGHEISNLEFDYRN